MEGGKIVCEVSRWGRLWKALKKDLPEPHVTKKAAFVAVRCQPFPSPALAKKSPTRLQPRRNGLQPKSVLAANRNMHLLLLAMASKPLKSPGSTRTPPQRAGRVYVRARVDDLLWEGQSCCGVVLEP